MSRIKQRNEVGRVVQNGGSLYLTLPTVICEIAGLRKGDRMAIDTDGRVVFAARIPIEDLLNQRVFKRDGWLAKDAPPEP